MKFVVSSSELLSGLLSISKVVSNKNTLPILDNFLLQLHDNVLRVTASDLETTLQVDLAIDNVEKEGEAAIPAKLIIDTLKEFPDQPLVFIIDETTLMAEISWSTGKFNIPCASADEYPQPTKLDETSVNSLEIESLALLEGVSKTIFATAADELRPIMNGIFFDINEAGLTFVATDAHKLVRYTLTNLGQSEACSFILPQKPATLLKSILGKDKQQVLLQFDSKNASFRTSRFRMICRLIEGVFPAYNTVIPNNPHKLTIDRLDFMAAAKRVAVFSNQSSNLIRLKVTGNEMTITAQDLDFSMSAIERVSCSFDGDDLQIGFKSSFLVEILASLSSTNVVVELADPSRAGIFLPFEKENANEDILMLLMPMMVGV